MLVYVLWWGKKKSVLKQLEGSHQWDVERKALSKLFEKPPEVDGITETLQESFMSLKITFQPSFNCNTGLATSWLL